MFISFSATFAHPGTLEHAIGNSDISYMSNIINCTQVVDSSLCEVRSWSIDQRHANKIGRALTEMPFSSSFVCLNPDRICLLDKRIPVPWRMAFRRISVDRVLGFFGIKNTETDPILLTSAGGEYFS